MVMVEACGNTEVIHIYCMLVFLKKMLRQLEKRGTCATKLRGWKDKSQLIKGSGDTEGIDYTRNLWVRYKMYKVRYKNTNKSELGIKNITLHWVLIWQQEKDTRVLVSGPESGDKHYWSEEINSNCCWVYLWTGLLFTGTLECPHR